MNIKIKDRTNQSFNLSNNELDMINHIQDQMKDKGLRISRASIIRRFFDVGYSLLEPYIELNDMDGFWSKSWEGL